MWNNLFNLYHYPVLKTRSASLDALRGLCALWVLFVHLIGWAKFSKQYEGNFYLEKLESIRAFSVKFFQNSGELNPAVLIFIILSGYCIHRNGLRNRDNLTSFAQKRFFRIYPTYIFAIFVGVICFKLAQMENAVLAPQLSGTATLNSIGLLAKVFLFNAFVPYEFTNSYQGNAPLATVLTEIILYCVYAVVFKFLIWNNKLKYLKVLLLVNLIGCLVFVSFTKDALLYSWFQNFSLYSFLIYWWIGAFAVSSNFPKSKAIVMLLLVFWVSITALLQYYPKILFIVELRKIVFALLICVFIKKIDGSSSLILTPFQAIGHFSYSLYAYHAPLVYMLICYNFNILTIFIFTLAISFILYNLIEKYFMKVGTNIAPFSKPKI